MQYRCLHLPANQMHLPVVLNELHTELDKLIINEGRDKEEYQWDKIIGKVITCKQVTSLIEKLIPIDFSSIQELLHECGVSLVTRDGTEALRRYLDQEVCKYVWLNYERVLKAYHI